MVLPRCPDATSALQSTGEEAGAPSGRYHHRSSITRGSELRPERSRELGRRCEGGTAVAASDEVLGEFLGDAEFPVDWASEPRRPSSGSTTISTSHIRSARCSSTSAAGGSAATTCSAASERRSRSTGWRRTSTATSTRPRSRPTRHPDRGHRVLLPLHRARPARPRLRRRMGRYLDTVLPVYGEHFADWWRDRLVPEMQRNFAFLEEQLDRAEALALPETGRRCSRTRSTSMTATGRSTGC